MEALQVDKLDDADDAAQRDRAVEALGRIGAPAVKPLTAALEGAYAAGKPETVKGQINVQARLAAIKALGLMGPAANVFKTQAVLSTLQRTDPSQAVRDAAKQARGMIRKTGSRELESTARPERRARVYPGGLPTAGINPALASSAWIGV